MVISCDLFISCQIIRKSYKDHVRDFLLCGMSNFGFAENAFFLIIFFFMNNHQQVHVSDVGKQN